MPFLHEVGLKGREALRITMTATATLSTLNNCSMTFEKVLMSSANAMSAIVISNASVGAMIASEYDTVPTTTILELDVGQATLAMEATIVMTPTTSSMTISSGTGMTSEVV